MEGQLYVNLDPSDYDRLIIFDVGKSEDHTDGEHRKILFVTWGSRVRTSLSSGIYILHKEARNKYYRPISVNDLPLYINLPYKAPLFMELMEGKHACLDSTTAI